jgi:hypothetical protein
MTLLSPLKTKYAWIIVLIITFSNTHFAQNAYFDALFLAENKDKLLSYDLKKIDFDTKDTLGIDFIHTIQFLKNPYADSINIDSIDFRKIVGKRDSIYRLIEKQIERSTDNILKSYSFRPKKSSSIYYPTSTLSHVPSTPILSATDIIDGTALFIKQRIKEELNLAFLKKFRRKLEANTTFRSLLPATFRALEGIAEMDNQLPSLNTVLANAFQSDLDLMTEHIEETILYDSAFDSMRLHPHFKYFALPINTIKHIQRGSHPSFVIQDLKEKYFRNETFIDKVIQTMAVLNANLQDTLRLNNDSVRNNPQRNVWINTDQWNALRQKKGDNLFMGLIFQSQKDSLFKFLNNKTSDTLKIMMSSFSENIGDYLLQLKSFETYYNLLKSTNRKSRDSVGIELAWSILQLVDKSHWMSFNFIENTKKQAIKDSFWLIYKPMMESTIKTVSAVQKKNYAGAVLNAYQVLRGLSSIPQWQGSKAFQNAYLQEFFYYTSFMSDVLTATNSEDVSDILNRYAAPVGSYSIKRNTRFSISLNAYPGLYIGRENPRMATEVKDSIQQKSGVFGVTAPIGLTLSKGGFGKNLDQSLSFFFPIIDIGAVLSYRWANDAAQGLPQTVEWAQIISPGIHLAYGFADSPLCITAGMQVTPKLRKVNEQGNTLRNTDFLRWSAGLNVDLTIFNFYNTGRRKHPRKGRY